MEVGAIEKERSTTETLLLNPRSLTEKVSRDVTKGKQDKTVISRDEKQI
jgi:hypothetical protein